MEEQDVKIHVGKRRGGRTISYKESQAVAVTQKQVCTLAGLKDQPTERV